MRVMISINQKCLQRIIIGIGPYCTMYIFHSTNSTNSGKMVQHPKIPFSYSNPKVHSSVHLMFLCFVSNFN